MKLKQMVERHLLLQRLGVVNARFNGKGARNINVAVTHYHVYGSTLQLELKELSAQLWIIVERTT